MDTDDSFKAASAQFLGWLNQNGTTVSDKIELADLRNRNAGRGVGMLTLPRWPLVYDLTLISFKLPPKISPKTRLYSLFLAARFSPLKLLDYPPS